MGLNIQVQKRIKVNGVEYSSPEEMPPDIRGLYEKAMAQQAAGASSPQLKMEVNAKLRFNGKEYANPDEMPPEIRKLYEDALALAGTRLTTPPTASKEVPPRVRTGSAVIQDAPAKGKWLLFVGIILLVLVVWYLAGRR